MAGPTRATWDQAASTFDDAPDHGLRDGQVRAAWREVLLDVLPEPPCWVLDVGSGTGTLTTLLAAEGFFAFGVDTSAGMLRVADAKAKGHGHPPSFCRSDASLPPFADDSFDVVVCRHVLWALDAPEAALAQWKRLIRPGGRLVLIEGRWETGVGLTLHEAETLISAITETFTSRRLDDPALWGRAVHDDRFLVTGRT